MQLGNYLIILKNALKTVLKIAFFPRPAFKKHEVVLEVDAQVDPSLRELVGRITPLCNHYSVIVRFGKKSSSFGKDQEKSFIGRGTRLVLGRALELRWQSFFTRTGLRSQSYETTNYNAIVVKSYNATKSLAHF
jgi:hypothetical protein